MIRTPASATCIRGIRTFFGLVLSLALLKLKVVHNLRQLSSATCAKTHSLARARTHTDGRTHAASEQASNTSAENAILLTLVCTRARFYL